MITKTAPSYPVSKLARNESFERVAQVAQERDEFNRQMAAMAIEGGNAVSRARLSTVNGRVHAAASRITHTAAMPASNNGGLKGRTHDQPRPPNNEGRSDVNDNLAGCVVWLAICFLASAALAITIILWKAAL